MYSTDFSDRPTSFEVLLSNFVPACCPPFPAPINGRKSAFGFAGANARSGPDGVCNNGISRGSRFTGRGDAEATFGKTTASSDDATKDNANSIVMK
ncbi:MAG TPA: hypothetical protein VEO01_35755 [Pseudonocardiaceae bacterium]|nr:hypothetical protein [Pseudonocardiaceae bacterium]